MGAAAVKLTRKFVGMKIDDDKFEVARAKIANVSYSANSNPT